MDELTVTVVVTDLNTADGGGDAAAAAAAAAAASVHVTVVDLDDSAPEFVGVRPSEAEFSIQGRITSSSLSLS